MSKAEIEAAVKSWVITSNRGDEPGMSAVYADDARVLPPNAKIIEGRQSIDAFVAGYVASGVQVSFDVLTIHDTPDLGVWVGMYAVTYPDDTPGDNGKCILVWRNEGDGSWRIVEDMWSSSHPAPAT